MAEIERDELITVPTELGRQDVFIDMIVILGLIAIAWNAVLAGVPIWVVAIFVLPAVVWMLTGEAASDIQIIGALAAGLRSKFGQRRAHEWVQAWAHYFKVAVLPIWRLHGRFFVGRNCVRCRRIYRRNRARVDSVGSRAKAKAEGLK